MRGCAWKGRDWELNGETRARAAVQRADNAELAGSESREHDYRSLELGAAGVS